MSVMREQAAPRTGQALVDSVAERIRERILSGDIPLGTPLRQAELADEFGVSRMPVREALRQLQNGGLISTLPHRGALVRVPAPWEVRDAFEVRAELEALAARRAAGRLPGPAVASLRELNATMRDRARAAPAPNAADPAHRHRGNETFHDTIAGHAGNGRLASTIRGLHDAFPRNILVQLLADDPGYGTRNFDEHDAVLEAIVDGDADRAATVMRDHVRHAGDQLARWFERRSSTVFHGGDEVRDLA